MSAGRKTIFLVDDDMTNLTVGKKALSGHYNVMTLGSGTLLLEVLENRAPDLILLDVNMPEMDGHETLKRVKANKKTAHIPVIFLTAHMDTKGEWAYWGAVDYILKPFSPELLLQRVEAHFMKP